MMFRSRFVVCVFAWAMIVTRTSFGQVGGGLGGGVGGGAAGGNNQNSSGIKIDPQGVTSLIVANDGAGSLDKARREAIARKSPLQNFGKRSKLRFVSLVELEKQIDQVLVEKQPIPVELFYLAGLQRLEYLFVFPDQRDVVIAGPAEGFIPDPVGRMIGVESGRPALRLDDLVVALRTVAKSRQLGCSIDPVPQRLAELQKFIKQGGPADIQVVERRFNQMDEILGLQDIRIDGVPPDSHFATMFVEADYRMKRIAIGLENPRVKGLKSHLATMGANGNTMQRWWFVPHYDSISRSQDGTSFQFSGPRAQLLTEEEVADANGNRSSSGAINKSAQAFARHFTEKFAQLADNSPVFGELQNLIDWSILSALLIKERIPERMEWKQELLLNESRLPHPVFVSPKTIPSQVNYKRAGNLVVGLVCGGVVLFPQQTYDKFASPPRDSTLEDNRSKVTESPRVDTHHWWWDAGK